MDELKPCGGRIATTISRNLAAGFLALYLAIAGVQASGQEPALPAADTEANTADNTLSLSGTVVNTVTGEPIPRAVVTVFGGHNNFSTLTDNSGHFEFNGLTQGRAFVNTARPGFGNQGYPYTTSVKITSANSPLLLKLAPTGTIVGRLTSRDGQPLEGYSLRLISKMSIGGTQRLSYQPYQSATDDDGNFRIANVPPSNYYLEVSQNQETTLSQRGIPNPREQAYPEIFYPGVPDLAVASPIPVSGGSEVEASFSLSAEPLYEISGAVSPEENFSFLAFSRKAGDGYDFSANATVQDGRFQVKLIPGSYNVRGSTAAGTQLSASGLAVSADNLNLHVALSPVPVLQVQVQKEKSSGSATLDTPDQPESMYISLQLTPVDGLRQNSYWWSPAQPNGIQNVEPGTYEVRFNAPQGPWWVRSLRSGNADLLNDNLTVADGAQPQPIEITLQDDAGIVQGTVSPRDDTLPATVLLVQPHGKKNLVLVAAAIQGKFAFQSVPPGEHLALAFDGSEHLDFMNPDALNPYLSGAQHITVPPHGTTNVNLSLTPIER